MLSHPYRLYSSEICFDIAIWQLKAGTMDEEEPEFARQ
jgi:hypothetical protein